VKFLSEEWAQAVTEALNNSEAFRSAAGSHQAKLQNVVNTPEGETRYYISLQDGKIEVGQGDIDGPDATLTQDYDTAVGLAKNEITGTAAYMSGKLKISGDLMKLMQLQGVINTLPAAMREIDVEY
jgi:putative sterol carrier protein